jgi:hypothetical protein
MALEWPLEGVALQEGKYCSCNILLLLLLSKHAQKCNDAKILNKTALINNAL